MATKRETIMANVFTAIDAAKPSGVSVSRNRLDPYSRDEGFTASVSIRPVNDVKSWDAIGFVNSRLTFAVDIASGLSQSAADDIAQAVYAAVMASNHGGQDIAPMNHAWDMEQGDVNASVLTMEFEVLYRHNWESLN